ncbi:MAG: 4-(cytidine 5'-diphospho)-2-C-methyl-D-erythritol kinase [Chakrabartia sp.]
MSMPVQDIGYAKINLALHIRARRADGYHLLETLFAFAETGDVLTAVPAADFTLEITGPFAAGLAEERDNLVLRAVRRLAKANDIGTGLHLTLNKQLPIAAGIGGGSADAAAALRLAARIWGAENLRVPPEALAADLGADVPACLAARTCFGTGIGEALTPVEGNLGVAGLPVLLVNPRLPCPTGPVFAAWDQVDLGPLTPADWPTARNDLEAPALRLVPEIGAVLAALRAQPETRLARMSGSGATCFAVFDSLAKRDAAAARLAKDAPGWWQLATQLR